jgi:hypothetical protein
VALAVDGLGGLDVLVADDGLLGNGGRRLGADLGRGSLRRMTRATQVSRRTAYCRLQGPGRPTLSWEWRKFCQEEGRENAMGAGASVRQRQAGAGEGPASELVEPRGVRWAERTLTASMLARVWRLRGALEGVKVALAERGKGDGVRSGRRAAARPFFKAAAIASAEDGRSTGRTANDDDDGCCCCGPPSP